MSVVSFFVIPQRLLKLSFFFLFVFSRRHSPPAAKNVGTFGDKPLGVPKQESVDRRERCCTNIYSRRRFRSSIYPFPANFEFFLPLSANVSSELFCPLFFWPLRKSGPQCCKPQTSVRMCWWYIFMLSSRPKKKGSHAQERAGHIQYVWIFVSAFPLPFSILATKER